MSLSAPAASRGSASGCTRMKMEHFTYDWVIEEFEYLPQHRGECIHSPIFRTTRNELEWRLCLFPRSKLASSMMEPTYVPIYLCLYSHKSETIKIHLHTELSIFPIKYKNTLNHTYVNKSELFLGGIERPQLISNSSGVITIHCKIHILWETITEPIDTTQSMEHIFDSQKGQLIQDFRLLFKEPKFSDIAVIVGTQKFPAHKLVLATRSSVFSAMFEHKETRENLKNEIKIERMEPEVVKAMLEFIYTDEVTNLKELAYGLLEAADKYDLQHLRSMCEKILYKTVNKDNAAEILIYADLHRSHKLKEYVMRFMDDHLFDVLETESYKEMKENYPALVNDLVLTIATHKKARLG